jgi:trehalose 6-phosphate phosphatase
MQSLSFDAVIFDLDGIVTDTARAHAAAWKSLFDEYLRERAGRYGGDYSPFSVTTDYPPYLDGKPRYDGVRSFLSSRRIDLDFGDPSDGPDEETICGLGNRKNRIFTHVLREGGVDVFESTLVLVHELNLLRIGQAVASSSKNCQRVLEAAGIGDLFKVRVDGEVSSQLGLNGKPAPDIFLKCAELLKVTPDRSVIVEDAISGVEAGRNGGFGLVIGVDRTGIGHRMKQCGADIVVRDLSQVSPDKIDRWRRDKETPSGGVGRAAGGGENFNPEALSYVPVDQLGF